MFWFVRRCVEDLGQRVMVVHSSMVPEPCLKSEGKVPTAAPRVMLLNPGNPSPCFHIIN